MRTTIACVLSFLAFTAMAQESVPALKGAGDKGRAFHRQGFERHAPPDTTVYLSSEVDVPPAHPEGEKAQMLHLARAAGCAPASGNCMVPTTVHVTFVVERDGRVGEARVERGGCPDFEAMALCAVRSLPAFSPALRRGTPVRCRLHVPVRYEPH